MSTGPDLQLDLFSILPPTIKYRRGKADRVRNPADQAFSINQLRGTSATIDLHVG
jgi:hypothetical protein